MYKNISCLTLAVTLGMVMSAGQSYAAPSSQYDIGGAFGNAFKLSATNVLQRERATLQRQATSTIMKPVMGMAGTATKEVSSTVGGIAKTASSSILGNFNLGGAIDIKSPTKLISSRSAPITNINQIGTALKDQITTNTTRVLQQTATGVVRSAVQKPMNDLANTAKTTVSATINNALGGFTMGGALDSSKPGTLPSISSSTVAGLIPNPTNLTSNVLSSSSSAISSAAGTISDKALSSIADKMPTVADDAINRIANTNPGTISAFQNGGLSSKTASSSASSSSYSGSKWKIM